MSACLIKIPALICLIAYSKFHRRKSYKLTPSGQAHYPSNSVRKYLSKFSSLLIAFSLFPSMLQAYPDGPLKLVVPFAPGGGSDTIARIIQKAIRDEKLSPVPLVIVNVPGAGGTIGSRQVRDAKADGQTLLLLHDGIFTAKYSGKVSLVPTPSNP